MKNLIFCAMVNISFHIIVMVSVKPRSSRANVFCKKTSSGNLAKFTGKHPCQSLFFNKVASLRPCKF